MSFNSLLINEISIITKSRTDWGDETETLATGVKSRVMFNNQVVRDFRGEEVVSVGKVFLKPDEIVKADSIIIIDGVRYSVLKINRPQNSATKHHIELYIA